MHVRLLLLTAAATAGVVAGWVANFEHVGALVGSSLESSPMSMGGKLYLMQSRMGEFAPDNGSHSFWCIYDMVTGEQVSCPPSSSGFAFASAIAFADATGAEQAWVFASAWDRAQSHAPNCKPWGCGACAQGHCYIAAWNSSDLVTWSGPFVALQLPTNVTVPNVGVGIVNRTSDTPTHSSSGLPTHYAFMALEGRIPGAQGNMIAVNENDDFNLGTGWTLLNSSEYASGGAGVGQASGCPAARFNPTDGYYYVIGGGNSVDVTRSANLTLNSWEAPPTGHVEQGCTYQEENCGAGAPMARIAPNYYVDYWENGSDRGDRDFLANLTSWQYSVNDVDVCDHAGVTYFIYGMCCQTAPSNFTGKCGNFYSLGTFAGTTSEWFASFFD